MRSSHNLITAGTVPPNAEAARASLAGRRVAHQQSPDTTLPVLLILGKQRVAVGLNGRRRNRAIPKRQAVPPTQRQCRIEHGLIGNLWRRYAVELGPRWRLMAMFGFDSRSFSAQAWRASPGACGPCAENELPAAPSRLEHARSDVSPILGFTAPRVTRSTDPS